MTAPGGPNGPKLSQADDAAVFDWHGGWVGGNSRNEPDFARRSSVVRTTIPTEAAAGDHTIAFGPRRSIRTSRIMFQRKFEAIHRFIHINTRLPLRSGCDAPFGVALYALLAIGP